VSGEVGAKAASLTITRRRAGGVRASSRCWKRCKNITLAAASATARPTNGQIIVALNIAAVGEAPLFASKAGADPAGTVALMERFAASRVLEVHGERMVKRTFNSASASPCTRRTWAWRSGARELGVAMPNRRRRPTDAGCAANGMAASTTTPCGRWKSWPATVAKA
jgi:2-hydroxy-3-oxopropionate reductase